jgi:hypothetical protein
VNWWVKWWVKWENSPQYGFVLCVLESANNFYYLDIGLLMLTKAEKPFGHPVLTADIRTLAASIVLHGNIS